MLILHALCVALVVVACRGEGEVLEAQETIYREAVANGVSGANGKAISSGVHQAQVPHGPVHGSTAVHGSADVHDAPIVPNRVRGGVHGVVHGGVHGGVHRGEPVHVGTVSGGVSHGNPVHVGTIHGPVVHGGSHYGPASHGGAVHRVAPHGGAPHGAVHGGGVHGGAPHGGAPHVTVHGGTPHGAVHDGGVHGGAPHGGPVVRRTSFVHNGPIIHGGNVHGGVVRTKIVPLVNQVLAPPPVHAPTPDYLPPVHAPAQVHAPAPVQPVLNQYHQQNGRGGYSFGYNAGTSSRDETRDPYGNVRGSFSYIDDNGKLQTQHYTAGHGGFRVRGTNLPVHVQNEGGRYKRSYAIFPAATEPLGDRVSYGPRDSSTVSHVVRGPVNVNRVVEYNHGYPVNNGYGYSAPAVSHGYSAPAVSHGYSAPIVSHGYSTPAVSHGYSVPAVSHGYSVPAVSHGYSAPAVHGYSFGVIPSYGNVGLSLTHGLGPNSQSLYGYGH